MISSQTLYNALSSLLFMCPFMPVFLISSFSHLPVYEHLLRNVPLPWGGISGDDRGPALVLQYDAIWHSMLVKTCFCVLILTVESGHISSDLMLIDKYIYILKLIAANWSGKGLQHSSETCYDVRTRTEAGASWWGRQPRQSPGAQIWKGPLRDGRHWSIYQWQNHNSPSCLGPPRVSRNAPGHNRRLCLILWTGLEIFWVTRTDMIRNERSGWDIR